VSAKQRVAKLEAIQLEASTPVDGLELVNSILQQIREAVAVSVHTHVLNYLFRVSLNLSILMLRIMNKLILIKISEDDLIG
jgi:hypothetical protein